MAVTKTYRVFGAKGDISEEYDFSEPDNVRKISILRYDKTGQSNYCDIVITRNTTEECKSELDGILAWDNFKPMPDDVVELISHKYRVSYCIQQVTTPACGTVPLSEKKKMFVDIDEINDTCALNAVRDIIQKTFASKYKDIGYYGGGDGFILYGDDRSGTKYSDFYAEEIQSEKSE